MLMLAAIAIGWSIGAMRSGNLEDLGIAIGLWLLVGIVLWIFDKRDRKRRKIEKIRERRQLRQMIKSVVEEVQNGKKATEEQGHENEGTRSGEGTPGDQ